jgi:2-dehydropantoate 2-reductase
MIFDRPIGIADRRGLQVPLSRRVVAMFKGAEAQGKGSPKLTPEQIRGPDSRFDRFS